MCETDLISPALMKVLDEDCYSEHFWGYISTSDDVATLVD